MELTHAHLTSATTVRDPAAVPFDVLRALVAARQAATPTAQAVAASEGVRPTHSFAAMFTTDSAFSGVRHDKSLPMRDERIGNRAINHPASTAVESFDGIASGIANHRIPPAGLREI